MWISNQGNQGVVQSIQYWIGTLHASCKIISDKGIHSILNWVLLYEKQLLIGKFSIEISLEKYIS